MNYTYAIYDMLCYSYIYVSIYMYIYVHICYASMMSCWILPKLGDTEALKPEENTQDGNVCNDDEEM